MKNRIIRWSIIALLIVTALGTGPLGAFSPLGLGKPAIAHADASLSSHITTCAGFEADGTASTSDGYVGVRIWVGSVGGTALVDSYANVGAPTYYAPVDPHTGAYHVAVGFTPQAAGTTIVARVYGAPSNTFGSWDGGAFQDVTDSCASGRLIMTGSTLTCSSFAATGTGGTPNGYAALEVFANSSPIVDSYGTGHDAVYAPIDANGNWSISVSFADVAQPPGTSMFARVYHAPSNTTGSYDGSGLEDTPTIACPSQPTETLAASALTCSSFIATGTASPPYGNIALELLNQTTGTTIYNSFSAGNPSYYTPIDSGGNWSVSVNFSPQPAGSSIEEVIYRAPIPTYGNWDGGHDIIHTENCVDVAGTQTAAAAQTATAAAAQTSTAAAQIAAAQTATAAAKTATAIATAKTATAAASQTSGAQTAAAQTAAAQTASAQTAAAQTAAAQAAQQTAAAQTAAAAAQQTAAAQTAAAQAAAAAAQQTASAQTAAAQAAAAAAQQTAAAQTAAAQAAAQHAAQTAAAQQTAAAAAQAAAVAATQTAVAAHKQPAITTLTIDVGAGTVHSGGRLPVRITAPPNSPVSLTLQVTGTRTKTITTGKGKSKKTKKVTQTVVLYRTTAGGSTDGSGHLTLSLLVSYKVTRNTPATLHVTAGKLSGNAGVTILPASTSKPKGKSKGGQTGSACALPCTINVGGQPAAVGLDTRSGRAFVANSASNTVSVLDTGRSKLLKTVRVGAFPWAIAVDEATSRVFVANKQSNSVSVLDSKSGAVRGTIDVGGTPWALVADARSGHVFVISGSRVSMLDARSGSVLKAINVGTDPTALAVDESTNRVFVTDQVSLSVSVLDGGSGALRRTVSVGEIPWTLAASSQSSLVFVARGNKVSLLDALSGALRRTVGVGTTPRGLALDTKTGRAFVANTDDGTVSVLDLKSGASHGTTTVGKQPIAIAVDATIARVFVANKGSNTLSVLDAKSGALHDTITVGKQPVAVAVDERRGRIVVVNAGGRGTVTVLDANAER